MTRLHLLTSKFELNKVEMPADATDTVVLKQNEGTHRRQDFLQQHAVIFQDLPGKDDLHKNHRCCWYCCVDKIKAIFQLDFFMDKKHATHFDQISTLAYIIQINSNSP